MMLPLAESFLICCFAFVTLGQNIEVEFRIDEGIAAGEEIGNIATKSGLEANLTAEVFRTLEYKILDDTEYKALLTLDSQTGALFTAVQIDRENIQSCKDKPECVMTLQIAANSATTPTFYIIMTKIVVNDINDNSPTFPDPVFPISISESESVGYAFTVPAAVDRDTGNNNGIVSYEIFPSNGTFGLNVTKKLDGSFLVQLVLKQPLDRETQEQYVVFVFAKDGGATPNSGKLQVDITVADVNDNPPVFTESIYNISVSEDTQPGTTILHLTATDKDKGENSKLEYKFSPHSPDKSSLNTLFAINNSTGEIYLLTKLVYEANEIYTIIVEATDKGQRPKVAQAKVNIKVEDAGNNQPIVKVNLLSGSGSSVSLSESAKVGAFVAHVNVKDADTGDNGRFECLANPNLFAIESLGTDYKVVIKTKLDREVTDTHNVTITCRDFGTPRLSSSESFVVNVVDDNDEDPVFLKDLYVAMVVENYTVGQTVVQVSATDEDIGDNAHVQYYLHSDAGSNFAINSNTGVITARTSFDRETTKDYKFRVLAVDQGDPQRTGTSTVIINIGDINDNNPKFNKTMLDFYIMENMAVDTVVGQLSASDSDLGDNAKLHYYMDSQDKFSVPFVVFPDGLIKSNQELDREFQSQYHFIVFAEDSGSEPRNSSVYVTVYVKDANDNEPIISFPNKMNNTVTSPVTSLPVTTIRAYDVDEGINKRLVYYIHSGNENGMFNLNANSGELFLNRNYPITTDQSVSLLICVKDSGNPIKTKCAQLNALITVNNATVPQTEESDNKYIIISIVVIIVTILISVGIVVTIFFIRQVDRNRQKLKNNQGPLGVPMQNGLPACSTTGNDPSQEQEYMERKKKEVTFCSSVRNEDNMGSYSGNYMVNLTNEVGSSFVSRIVFSIKSSFNLVIY